MQEEGTGKTDLSLVSVEKVSPQIVPLYQYWNSHVSDNFYIYTVNSRDWIDLQENWSSWIHSVACLELFAPDDTAIPLHQYYVGGHNANHFYTTNAGELEPLLLANMERMATNIYEGVAGYCYKTQQPNTGTLYRMYGEKMNDQFYTKDHLPCKVGNQGYNYDGMKCKCSLQNSYISSVFHFNKSSSVVEHITDYLVVDFLL